MHVRKRVILLAGLVLGLGALLVPLAAANSVGPITFEPSQIYVAGPITGQNGWMKDGPYDVQVALVATYPAAADYGFDTQALRMSDAVTSGSFGDQTFSPGVDPAGENTTLNHFESTFAFGSTQATEQVGMHVSVSPDSGDGGRMSYLRFEDRRNGVHVFFDDVHNPGPIGHVSNFRERHIAVLSRDAAHTIRFKMQFKPGPGNDKVTIYIDGKKEVTGTTWENYYRYDPEQTPTGNQVPTTSKMLFRESGTANAADLNNGFLVDGLLLSSTNRVHH
jgi:hypothetical protein